MAFDMEDDGTIKVLSLREYEPGILNGLLSVLRLELVPRLAPHNQIRCVIQFQMSVDQATQLIEDLMAQVAKIHKPPPAGAAH